MRGLLCLSSSSKTAFSSVSARRVMTQEGSVKLPSAVRAAPMDCSRARLVAKGSVGAVECVVAAASPEGGGVDFGGACFRRSASCFTMDEKVGERSAGAAAALER